MKKDFIEKVFRCIKTDEGIKPVRYRLESRIRGFIFISILAYRLLAVLRWRIYSSESSNVTLSMAEFLMKLSRVHKLEADLGKEGLGVFREHNDRYLQTTCSTWYEGSIE